MGKWHFEAAEMLPRAHQDAKFLVAQLIIPHILNPHASRSVAGSMDYLVSVLFKKLSQVDLS